MLPSLLAYRSKFGKYPPCLTFSLAKLIELYKKRLPADDPAVVEMMQSRSVREIVCDEKLWGADLSAIASEVEKNVGV